MRSLALLAVLIASPALAQGYGYNPPQTPSFGTFQTPSIQPYGTGSNPSSHYTQGYTTNNGTFVQPHSQTNPNNTQTDNYGTRGNVNPYTGAYGTRAPRY